MATFTAGTSFTDGVTGDVTASKLNALVANATPLANLITDRTAETSIATDDLVMISDTSESGAINKMTVANLMKAELTGTINSTAGTISTLNSTTGVIPTLTSTTLITSGTGTAAAPAIVPTGDTNTGIFFPAADTIAFSEGGTESMRIDSSGRVGIGTTSARGRLEVSSALISGETGSQCIFPLNVTIGNGGGSYGSIGYNLDYRSATDNTTGVKYLIGDTISQLDFSAGGFIFRGAPVGTLGSTATLTERLRIDSDGNVGIGTTSPSNKLEVNGNIRGSNISVPDTNYIGFGSFTSFMGGSSASNFLTLNTNSTERLRITSGGEVYIAGTTDQGAYNLQVNGTGVWGAGAYVNGSDERLKENIQDITSGLDVVEKLRPVSFQYKEDYTADRSVQSGFIAQDLLVALEGKNYLEGVVSQGPTYYNVAYQNLIPILAKAIQELKAENDSLKTRIAALEAA